MKKFETKKVGQFSPKTIEIVPSQVHLILVYLPYKVYLLNKINFRYSWNIDSKTLMATKW